MELVGIYIMYVLTFTTYYYKKTTLINLFKWAIAKGDSLDSENRLRTQKHTSHTGIFMFSTRKSLPLRSARTYVGIRYNSLAERGSRSETFL